MTAFLVGCCSHLHSVPQRNHLEEDILRYQTIRYLENSTVALQFQPDIPPEIRELLPPEVRGSLWRTYCTGVWISPHKILTARHCVMEDPESNVVNKTPGMLIRYRTNIEINAGEVSEPPRELLFPPHWAVVVAVDADNDLAIISSIDEPNHDIVTLSTNYIYEGSPVHIIGHTIRMNFTYLQGVISKTRKYDLDDSPPHKMLQISTPAFRGNSGGGAFDLDGHLVGICSLLRGGAPNVVLFVHRDVIEDFIKREQINLSE